MAQDRPDRPHRPSGSPSSGQAWAAAGASFEMAGAVAGGCAVGYLLDRWLDTGPWLLITGAVLGSLLGFWALVRLAMKKPRR